MHKDNIASMAEVGIKWSPNGKYDGTMAVSRGAFN